jgi:hypothetical protein
MNISTEMRKKYTDEVRFVLGQMKRVSSPEEKLYFFSAVYGILQRIVNFEYDPELLFDYQILQLVYNMLNARLAAIKARQETGISIPDGLFEKIEEALEELADSVDVGGESYSALQKMVNLAYTTSGNGYYMYLKGVIKV